MTSFVVLSAAAALQLIVHSSSKVPTIVVSDARVRPVPATLSMTAGYFIVRNMGAKADRLTAVTCACAAEVSAHESDEKSGMTSMRASGSVTIPAHDAVVFSSGARHLMLMGVKGGVKPGQTVKITLSFAHAGRITVPFVGRN